MGLLTNLFISVVNLVFVAMDILLLIFLAKAVYQRWKPSWLKQIVDVLDPLISVVLDRFQRLVSRYTDKTYSQRTLFNLLVFSLWITRLMLVILL
ncbi:MAG: hypothetical protein A2Y10_13825 [Planctomycetes bacterium GWF2_41_51]|nr:MAG: hypothetical protein A2Y10_13825 [Planctomycetes bacterium GWF2_41_51]HBG25971.1 hypothetical protein [Phycisphaerales bacterium]